MAKSWDICSCCGPGEWEEIEENVGFCSNSGHQVQAAIRISGPWQVTNSAGADKRSGGRGRTPSVQFIGHCHEFGGVF